MEKLVGQKKEGQTYGRMCFAYHRDQADEARIVSGTDKLGLTQKKYWWNLATRQEFTSFSFSNSDSGKNQNCTCRSYHTTPHPEIPNAAGGAAAAASAANTVER